MADEGSQELDQQTIGQLLQNMLSGFLSGARGAGQQIASDVEEVGRGRGGPLLENLFNIYGGGGLNVPMPKAPEIRPMLSSMAKVFKPAAEGSVEELLQMMKPVSETVRQVGSKIFKQPAQQIATFASKGTQPLSEYTKLWPGWGNPKTGEVRHSLQPILVGWHEPNTPMKMIGKNLVSDPSWVRGHVDPLTWKFHPENDIGQMVYEMLKAGGGQ